MNYNFSLSNGSESRLYNHTRDIIHVFTQDGRGIRTRMDAATSPSIAMYVVLTYCATEVSPKEEDQIVKLKDSVYRGSFIFLFINSMNYNFSTVMEATLVVFTSIPEIQFMHLLMTDVGFEPVLNRRRRLALRCVSSLPTALPRLSPKKEAQIV